MTTFPAVPAMAMKKMQQWAKCEQCPRQHAQRMRPMLAEQKKSGDRQKPD